METTKNKCLLDSIEYPSDLKKLKEDELPQLCQELRDFIIEQTAKNPGHLGASLGVIEITVAIHYVFDTPHDQIVWDVGHQAYAHKILTGRKNRFSTNRKYKGISGFPKMTESEYDAFGAGHASISLSALLGMTIGDRMLGNDKKAHIALIGDGAMGGGIAFEALNHIGGTDEDLLVILNDNHIAIDERIGGMNRYLLDITTSHHYNRFKNTLWKLLTLKRYKPNFITRSISSLAALIKGNIARESNLFEHLGFRYFGPSDGHDVQMLVNILQKLKQIKGPKIFHVITKKGKGLPIAEQNQVKFHAPGCFDPHTGEIIEVHEEGKPIKFQDVFGKTLLEIAEQNPKVVGVTPAMLTGCSMTIMRDQMPDRVFDVGIAEQHAVTFSAGLARSGMIPFCNIYSSFLQRGYDQIIHDVALQKLPVVICIDRAGIVGEDGATHHGAFDLAYLRPIPNMVIASPINETELRNMMFTATQYQDGPFAIRYPRGHGSQQEWRTPLQTLEIGKAEWLHKGEKVAILSLGPLGVVAMNAIKELKKEGINPSLINVRFLKPFDETLIDELLQNYSTIITIEDGVKMGGLYSTVSELITAKNTHVRLFSIAIPDTFVEHGDLSSLHHELGFDQESIAKTIKACYDHN
ncbi:MAG TPA: 1-deoxy-D-xylulose-5-phosphate synthase [Bacteroidales bacterium]|nr:1-deoxy-D-xylulose-5-phosphate synthase [Bacteroidales bacterium]HOH22304.1 1-deoxy-D-xylulose-5-phosphate synthase [Bacteroidales bacterium]HPB57136.1 1-deoxy-D-xylulose-5-phosphate synthase [Bacteroidales bacterium]HPZ03237.1 1-deoxy-D-xylulose-5-phosphate synthase [Bacteroidales bacterium]HQB74620.1 1-deoxy-D-xylulose-5-phosphate synthase [Bacteroidales bacterium]